MIHVDVFKKLQYADLRISFQTDREVLVIQGASAAEA